MLKKPIWACFHQWKQAQIFTNLTKLNFVRLIPIGALSTAEINGYLKCDKITTIDY